MRATKDSPDAAGTQLAQPKPSIGRIVHFRKGSAAAQAAIITRVHSDTCVDVAVFTSSDPAVVTRTSAELVDPNEGAAVGWFWPPRV